MVKMPLALLLPPTPLMITCWPVFRPCATLVMTIGFVLLAAVMAPLSQVVWQEGEGRLRIADFYPAQAKIINGLPRVHLEGTEKEGDQSWTFGLDLAFLELRLSALLRRLRRLQRGAGLAHLRRQVVSVELAAVTVHRRG